MTATGIDLHDLEKRLVGQAIGPDDSAYDSARQVWNGMIDRRPAVVVRCASESDIAVAIDFAQSRGLPLAVRGGGHSVAGHSAVDGGVAIDLRPLNDVIVDPDRRVMVAGGGTVLGDLDRAGAAHGLVTPAGVVSHTGTGGLTLGGGVGWLTRKFGLTCDNIVSARVVLANGDTVVASEDENPDLLWALRGGGGNFGVVSAFTFRCHPLPREVPVGWAFWPLDHARAVLRAWSQQLDTQPDEWKATAYMLRAVKELGVPDALIGQPGVMVFQVWAAPDLDGAQRALGELLRVAPAAASTVDWMRYVDLQRREDELAAPGRNNYTKGGYLARVDDSVIDVMIECATELLPDGSMLEVIPHRGAQLRLDEDDAAFPDRAAPYSYNFTTRFPLGYPFDSHIEWARRGVRRLGPLASRGVYTNFFAFDDHGQDRVLAAYGPAKYDRLARLKAIYDPDNTFRLNGNIRPAGRQGAPIGPARIG